MNSEKDIVILYIYIYIYQIMFGIMPIFYLLKSSYVK